MGCCFSSSSGGPDKEIDEIALPEVFPHRVGGVNLDHSYSDRPWYKRFDLICPIIVILLFGLLVSWALMSSGTSFTDSKHQEIASGTYQTIASHGVHLQSTRSKIKAEAQDFITKLRKAGIKLVLFDMDHTATSAHARGCLTTTSSDNIYESRKFDDYVASASVHFKYIVPILLDEKFDVAIVTFSDKNYYEDENDHPQSLAGEDLVKAFLERVFPELYDRGLDDVGKIGMFGMNAARYDWYGYPEEKRNKNTHIAKMCGRFGVHPSKAVLFDDTDKNVEDANNDTDATAYLVDRDTGRGFEFRYFDPQYRKT
eukprot:355217_1